VEVGLVLEALQVPLVVLLEEGKSLLLGDVGPVGPQGDPVALEVWVVGAGGEHAGGAPHRGGARPPEGGPSSPHHHLHRLQVSVELIVVWLPSLLISRVSRSLSGDLGVLLSNLVEEGLMAPPGPLDHRGEGGPVHGGGRCPS